MSFADQDNVIVPYRFVFNPELVPKYDFKCGEEIRENTNVQLHVIGRSGIVEIEGTDDCEESVLCIALVLCGCGVKHIVPSEKTVAEQIFDIIKKERFCLYNTGNIEANDRYLLLVYNYEAPGYAICTDVGTFKIQASIDEKGNIDATMEKDDWL